MAAAAPFPIVGMAIDVARRLEQPDTLMQTVTGMHEAGYNVCLLYLEDAYAYPRHPGIGRRHAYTPDTMQALQARCATQGMELIPCIPALGHCAYITQKSGYAHYDEGYGSEHLTSTVSPSIPETYELLRELFEDWSAHVPGNYLHVGLDESPALGRYAESQGLAVDHAQLFASHCNRLNAIVKALGRRMIMWADMFYYYPQAIADVDNDIIVTDWYYYSFADTPRIEAFNFADVDLTGALKQAGFEVWGVPSVWPNMPIGDIRDRWQNVADWTRYLQSRGGDGLLISDWENSTGFAANSDLLFRAFGQLLRAGGELEGRLAEALVARTGTPAAGALAKDLLALGQHHLTGRADRLVFHQPAAALASPARQARCRQHWQAIEALLPELPAVSALTTSVPGKRLTSALALSRRVAALAWELGAAVPEFADRVAELAAGASDPSLAADLERLAAKAAVLAADYTDHWSTVRYGDDAPPVSDWLQCTIDDLTAWAEAIRSLPPVEHPLYRQPRFQTTLECRHPALPVARIEIRWSAGPPQVHGRAMINFASAYATPDMVWQEYPCVPLDREALPAEIAVQVNNYGQIGVRDVSVVWRGRTHHYRREDVAGAHVICDGDVVWLGPIGARVTDPTIRPDIDEAVYRPAAD